LCPISYLTSFLVLARMSVPFLFLLLRRHPSSPLFPYTTLFRSKHIHRLIVTSATYRQCSSSDAAGVTLHDNRLLWRLSWRVTPADRKSTRLNSSHEWISYAVFCLKKKTTIHR